MPPKSPQSALFYKTQKSHEYHSTTSKEPAKRNASSKSSSSNKNFIQLNKKKVRGSFFEIAKQIRGIHSDSLEKPQTIDLKQGDNHTCVR